MALVLLRLRLTIARRARGHGNGAQLYFATSWVLGGVGGLLAGMASAALVSGDGPADLLLVSSFCAIFLPWVVGPIVEPTLADGVVDPLRLEQFPLTGWQQVSGLLAGALVAPTAAFTFLFASGGVIALSEAWEVRLASLLVALAYTVMCVAVSRAAQALLSNALRSRRGTDIAAFGASLLVLGLYLFAQQAQATTRALGGQSASGVLGTVLSLTPPGAAGRAVLDARDGQWLDFALRLVILVVTIVLAAVIWGWVLTRRVNVGTGSQHRARPRNADDPVLTLTPAFLKVLPPGPARGAASQQLRYFFLRSPRAIQTLVIPPVMGVVVAHASFVGYGLAAQSAAFAAMSVVAGSFNLFGYDGPGFTYFVLGGAPMRRVLIGKALAPLLYLLPLVVAFTVVEAWIREAPVGDVLPALLAGGCVITLGLGVGSASSVMNPSDQSRVSQRRGSFLKVFTWFMSFFFVAGVGGGLWWVASRFTGQLLMGVLMLALSIVVARALLGWSGRRLERDPYTVIRKLDPRTT